MKKIFKIFTLSMLLLAAATTSASAQLYYGVKAGANVSTLSAAAALGDSTGEMGYQAGVVVGAKIPIVGIGVEAEALYIQNKISFSSYGDIISNSIEIPVMAAIPIFPMLPISIKVGPSFVLHNTTTAEIMGVKSDIGSLKSDVGYTVGLGLKLTKFTLDVRYNGQFSSTSPLSSVMGDYYSSSYDISTGSISASLGYRF